MLGFTIDIQQETGGLYTASCPDFPGVAVQDPEEGRACKKLQAAVERSLFTMIKGKQIIPIPSRVNNRKQAVIYFPVLVVAKIYLVNTMIEKRIAKTELAKRLKCHMQQIDRLLDFCHASKIERVEEALKVLGRGLEIRMSDTVPESLSVKMLEKN